MNPFVLDVLEIDPDTVWRRVEFFESFPERFGSRIEHQDEWVRLGTAATSLRFAAQYAAVVDAERARSLISESARHYASLGLPYGYFLWSCFLNKDDAVETLSFGRAPQQLGSLTSHKLSEVREPGPLGMAALTYPVQQAYLLLAMSAYREVWAEFRSAIGSLSESLLAHRAQPIGPQGMPIESYMRLGWLLHQLHERRTKARIQAIAALAGMAERYALGIQEARQNTYLWRNLQSPVDMVDIEIAGLTGLLDSALRQASLEPMDLHANAFARLSPVALVPIIVGLEMREYRHPARDV